MTALAGVTSALGPEGESRLRSGLVRGLAHGAPTPCGDGDTVGHADGVQVGPLRTGDDDVDEAAHRQVDGQVHDAVDLGRLVHGAALAGSVDKDLSGGADECVSPSRRDGILQLGAFAKTLQRELRRHLLLEPGGVGAVLARVREEAGPVELRRTEEFEQEIVIALGLAGVAEDEGGAEGGVGVGRPDVVDAAEEAVAVAPAAHAGKQRARDVLQREVEVRHARGDDGLDQLIGQPRGIEIEQPGALHAGRHGAGERGDGRRAVGNAGAPARSGPVTAVGGEILGDEHDLAQGRRAVGGDAQRVDLGQHLLGRTGPLLAPERRDGAEATDAIATLGHLDVGPRGTGGGPRQFQEVEPVRRRRRGGGTTTRGEGDGYGARCGGSGELVPEAGDEIDLGQGVAQLLAVPLGHAAGDDQAGAGAAPVSQVQDGVDRLLAGRLNEGARVDHDEVGRLGIRGAAVSLRSEIALELVGIDLVLRAPQGLQPVEAHDVTHSSHQAESRRGDGPRQAHLSGPAIRIVRHHVPDIRAEREGFEPSDPVTQVKSLAVTPIRPLSHLSSRTFSF